MLMKLKIATLVFLLVVAAVGEDDLDQGTIRLQRLKERSLETRNRIINFNHADFQYDLPHLESS